MVSKCLRDFAEWSMGGFSVRPDCGSGSLFINPLRSLDDADQGAVSSRHFSGLGLNRMATISTPHDQA
jgi:hypothetical protein